MRWENPIQGLAIMGTVLGGIGGYIMRPSVFLAGGQLPFHVVITRGATLHPVSKLLYYNAAVTANNYLIFGALIGLVVGGAVGIAIAHVLDRIEEQEVEG